MRAPVTIEFKGKSYDVICDFAFIQRCENAGVNLMELAMSTSEKKPPRTTDIVAVVHAALGPLGVALSDIQEEAASMVGFWMFAKAVSDLTFAAYAVDPETLPKISEGSAGKKSVKKKAR